MFPNQDWISSWRTEAWVWLFRLRWGEKLKFYQKHQFLACGAHLSFTAEVVSLVSVTKRPVRFTLSLQQVSGFFTFLTPRTFKQVGEQAWPFFNARHERQNFVSKQVPKPRVNHTSPTQRTALTQTLNGSHAQPHLLHCLCHVLRAPGTPSLPVKLGNSRQLSRPGRRPAGNGLWRHPAAVRAGRARPWGAGCAPPARCPHKTTLSWQHLPKEPPTSLWGVHAPGAKPQSRPGPAGIELGCSTPPQTFAN